MGKRRKKARKSPLRHGDDSRKNVKRLSDKCVTEWFDIKDKPESETYRHSLVPYINKQAVISGTFSQLVISNENKRRGLHRIVLSDVTVMSCNGRAVNQAETDHIWLLCDKMFVKRNGIRLNDRITVQGWFHEYTNLKGKRNIGFKLERFITSSENAQNAF